MARVIKAWTASYIPALRVSRAEQVRPGKLDDEFPGWQWVENQQGLGGWVPATRVGSDGVMLEDFDTRELSAEVGDLVETFQQCLGWTYCQSSDRRTGWLPNFCLSES